MKTPTSEKRDDPQGQRDQHRAFLLSGCRKPGRETEPVTWRLTVVRSRTPGMQTYMEAVDREASMFSSGVNLPDVASMAIWLQLPTPSHVELCFQHVFSTEHAVTLAVTAST